MNEVIAVLYYCFWKYGSESVISTQYLESDLFFCFSTLMAELKDGFLRDMDKEQSGIHGKCRDIEVIVSKVDPEAYGKLRREKIETQYYALRWVMLLMCQDFEMPNCIRLWDTLLADEKRFDFLNYVCASVVISVHDTIMEGDFAQIMECLQSQAEQIPDVSQLLQDAWVLKHKYLEALAQEESDEDFEQLQ